MICFAEAWPDQAQITALAQHLGWSHFKEILYLESDTKATVRYFSAMG
jgi:hypothetical protein